MTTATTVPPRSAIAKEHTWNTESVFASDAAWEAEIEALAQAAQQAGAYRGRLAEGPDTLADALDAAYDVSLRAHKVYLYANMHHDVDTGNTEWAAMRDRAIGAYTRTRSAIAYMQPELISIGFERLSEWSAQNDRLGVFDHYFDNLKKNAEHVRSAEVEELLSQVRDPFQTATTVHGTFADSELPFAPARTSTGETVDIAQGNIGALLTNPDRELRRTAWENYADAHLTFKNTMAGVIATGVKQNVFMARARRYNSALEASLLANNLTPDIFHSLIDTYKQNLPTWHRYWNVRRKALGYDTLHVYDIKAPLTEQVTPVPYEQSIAWVSDGMRPLGDEYVSVMRRGLEEQRWVDIYPNQGKRAGAYSSGAKDTHPFILMSYNDDLFSMSTLAHELGHSMHSYYTRTTQPPVYANYTIFLAEVASNFNQALVRDYLLKQNTDRDFQISVIEEAMSNFHRYFFIMPTLARFELELHQRAERGQALSADVMNKLMTELFAEGYGSEVEIDADRIGITWAQFPTHMYLNFYVFQYATGISGAHALASDILAGKDGAVDRYLGFLKAGNSRYPLDTLRAAGVDMTSPAPVEQTFQVLASYVDRLEELTA